MSTHQQHLANDSITAEVVRAVAARRGVDPTELEPPLHRTVDTEALDELFSSTKRGPRRGTVTFTYCGQRVTVRSDDTVEIEIESENENGSGDGTEIEYTNDRNTSDRR